MKKLLSKFFGDKQAVALIEFAFVLPILLLLFAGAIELTRYVLANQRVDKAANALGDFVSQLPNPETVNMNRLLTTFRTLMEPYGTDQSQFTISTIYHRDTATQDTDPLYVQWQRRRGGLAMASRVGSVGGTPNAVVRGLGIRIGERLIAVETFYKHRNLLENIAGISKALDYSKDAPIYKVAYFRGRVTPGSENPPGRNRNIPALSGCCGDWCRGFPNALPPCACVPENGGCTSDPAILGQFPDSCTLCEPPPSGGGGGGGGGACAPANSCKCDRRFCRPAGEGRSK